MIDLQINERQLQQTAKLAKEKGILIPTMSQMKDPDQIPDRIKEQLKNLGLWEVHPANLFRISWKNERVDKGGLFSGVNYLELPSELTGVPARIVGLLGKWFPTGAHKVGATFGCLIPGLVTGQFDPISEKAVWPSTGNYCRGGAYNSELLSCDSIAILPEEMSKERFEWLSNLAGEVIATPGSESNVKEIFDKCWELIETRDNIKIFNQFDEFGNYLWHYDITGSAMLEAVQEIDNGSGRVAGTVLTTGSSGTLAAADLVKEHYPLSKVVACEALQCPTLLYNGFGAHRIEGIGDKHVPWIHNVRNTDLVIGIDDNHTMEIARLFNENRGQELLVGEGVSADLISRLPEMGVSSVANMIAAIKFARYYELTEEDIVLTVFTDSMDLYGSRLQEMEKELGSYDERAAISGYKELRSLSIDHVKELNYYDRKSVHNLKYFTWIEQQGKEMDELNAQWYDRDNYWGNTSQKIEEIDRLIEEFNSLTGLAE